MKMSQMKKNKPVYTCNVKKELKDKKALKEFKNRASASSQGLMES